MKCVTKRCRKPVALYLVNEPLCDVCWNYYCEHGVLPDDNKGE